MIANYVEVTNHNNLQFVNVRKCIDIKSEPRLEFPILFLVPENI